MIPEKPPSPTPLIEEAIAEGRRLAHENRLEGKDLDELAELEDDEDEAFLAAYRDKRMRELGALAQKSRFGSVYPVSKPDYAREVTEASKERQDAPSTAAAGVGREGESKPGTVVMVNLTAPPGGAEATAQTESRVLSALWRQAATEYAEVKFCEMRADQAIEGYPERNCPTILVYRNGDIVKQVVTLREWGGARIGIMDLDELLIEVGAITDGDMRVLKRRRDAEEAAEELLAGRGIKGPARGNGSREDDEDDWD